MFWEILLPSSVDTSKDTSTIITLPDDERSFSWNVESLNILVHEVINLLYYEHWAIKRKYFYIYIFSSSNCFFFFLSLLMLKDLNDNQLRKKWFNSRRNSLSPRQSKCVAHDGPKNGCFVILWKSMYQILLIVCVKLVDHH